MTDVPPPPRPANDRGDERPSPETPTQAVGATAAPETTQLDAGGVPASGEQYPGPPPGAWPPVPAARGGRLRRIGGRLRGSRVALAVVAVVVAAGLALGGFALADGGRDGKSERNDRGTASQRDGRNGNDDNQNGNNDRNTENDNDGSGRDGSGRGGRDGMGTTRDGRDAANDNGGATSGTEQSVLGTVTAVSQTSITLRTSGGSPVYPLTATTPITRNGSAAAVTDLKVGDAVVVHVATASTGAAPVVERISAG